VHSMGSGIGTAEGLEVGHQNIELVEVGGTHPANAPSTRARYIQDVSELSTYVCYK
jgi:hypothetical protein